MHIGNHCVLFKGDIVTKTREIVSALKEGGAEGCEIGKRFLGELPSLELGTLLKDEGMTLSAYHIVVSLPDILSDSSSFHSDIVKAGEYLENFDTKNILVSALVMPMSEIDGIYDRERWDERLFKEENLRKIGEIFNDEAIYLEKKGIQLHLHNHDWEFLFSSLLMNTYLEYAPKMNIALDIGWCSSAGVSPVDLFRKYPGRFTYIHARDLLLSELPACQAWSAKHDKLFCDLGEGELSLREIVKVFDEITSSKGWITIEYESGEVSYERYSRATKLLREMLK